MYNIYCESKCVCVCQSGLIRNSNVINFKRCPFLSALKSFGLIKKIMVFGHCRTIHPKTIQKFIFHLIWCACVFSLFLYGEFPANNRYVSIRRRKNENKHVKERILRCFFNWGKKNRKKPDEWNEVRIMMIIQLSEYSIFLICRLSVAACVRACVYFWMNVFSSVWWNSISVYFPFYYTLFCDKKWQV